MIAFLEPDVLIEAHRHHCGCATAGGCELGRVARARSWACGRHRQKDGRSVQLKCAPICPACTPRLRASCEFPLTCRAADSPRRQQRRRSVLKRFPGHAKPMLSDGEQSGFKRISHRERSGTGGGNVPEPKTVAAGSACRGSGWIRGNRRVLCAGPGGESDTIAIVDV